MSFEHLKIPLGKTDQFLKGLIYLSVERLKDFKKELDEKFQEIKNLRQLIAYTGTQALYDKEVDDILTKIHHEETTINELESELKSELELKFRKRSKRSNKSH